MRRALWVTALVVVGLVSANHELRGADEQTVAGIISDSSCKDDHGGEVDPKECTAKCVGNGEKYVLMVDGGTRPMQITNQDFAGLAAHAGDSVKVTGTVSGDAIAITRIQ